MEAKHRREAGPAAGDCASAPSSPPPPLRKGGAARPRFDVEPNPCWVPEVPLSHLLPMLPLLPLVGAEGTVMAMGA